MARDTALAESYEWFFKEHYPRVVRAVHLVVHNPELAADATQDAFAHTLRNWRRVSRYDRPDAWVRRVAMRAAIKAARRDRMRSLLESTLEEPTAAKSRDLDLMREVRALPPLQRASVALFYYEDLSVSDISDILGCSSATVKVHLHRARKKLANALNPEAVDATG